jgi:hypothetical protein
MQKFPEDQPEGTFTNPITIEDNDNAPSVEYRSRYRAKGSENGLLVEKCICASICMIAFTRGTRKIFAADGSR